MQGRPSAPPAHRYGRAVAAALLAAAGLITAANAVPTPTTATSPPTVRTQSVEDR